MGRSPSSLGNKVLTLKSSAKKSYKESKNEEQKVKRALQKGNSETARIYAENALRKHIDHVNYVKLAARVDTILSRVQSAASVSDISSSMSTVVNSMTVALSSPTMNPEKITQMMDIWENQLGQVDSTMESPLVTPKTEQESVSKALDEQIATLLQRVADENSLDISAMFEDTDRNMVPRRLKPGDEKLLSERLEKLRSSH